MNKKLDDITSSIIARSTLSRKKYLLQVEKAGCKPANRDSLSCTNQAHAYAAADHDSKLILKGNTQSPNIAIISAYNDLLSAHHPYASYPEIIKKTLIKNGCTGQFAAGVPSMCDGITQGQTGMELSLFSRDLIAQSSAIALSHHIFDGGLMLGICDKIVPGLLIGALRFGHLPFIFVPAGPMPSGENNEAKAKTRQLFAEGSIGKEELLASEMKSYHSEGTCTFYGTANTNQILMEVMGLHIPGSAFVNPGTPLRDELTSFAAKRVSEITQLSSEHIPIAKVISEKSIINAIVMLLATGGSTNHTIHLIAIAKAAGIQINWDDFDALSNISPLLTRIYPNGSADINQFQMAGGVPVIINRLLEHELLHEDVLTIMGQGLSRYTKEPRINHDRLVFKAGPTQSLNTDIITNTSGFKNNGGLSVVQGNLGRAISKTSALSIDHLMIQAPAKVFLSQSSFMKAFKDGELFSDFVAVLPWQGPAANGMPELHQLTPALTSLQDKGHRVALITDGRMSGAFGKILAAIHVTPESKRGGLLAKIKDGDLIKLDAENGELSVLVDPVELQNRTVNSQIDEFNFGYGLELFKIFRDSVSSAEDGATTF